MTIPNYRRPPASPGGRTLVVTSPQDLIFRLDEWPVGSFDLTLNLPAATLLECIAAPGEIPPVLVSPFTGSLQLHLLGQRLLIRGHWSARVEAVCDRCLAPTKLELGSAVDETLVLSESGGLAPGLADEDSPEFWPVTSGVFDLTPFLAEMFWLGWPFRVICREECQGLCPSCGADLNLGPCACTGRI